MIVVILVTVGLRAHPPPLFYVNIPAPPLPTLPVNFRQICWNFVLWGRRFCQSFHHDDCLGMLKTGLPGGAFFIFLTGIVLSFIL